MLVVSLFLDCLVAGGRCSGGPGEEPGACCADNGDVGDAVVESVVCSVILASVISARCQRAPKNAASPECGTSAAVKFNRNTSGGSINKCQHYHQQSQPSVSRQIKQGGHQQNDQ